jgi:hypothetical protein
MKLPAILSVGVLVMLLVLAVMLLVLALALSGLLGAQTGSFSAGNYVLWLTISPRYREYKGCTKGPTEIVIPPLSPTIATATFCVPETIYDHMYDADTKWDFRFDGRSHEVNAEQLKEWLKAGLSKGEK